MTLTLYIPSVYSVPTRCGFTCPVRVFSHVNRRWQTTLRSSVILAISSEHRQQKYFETPTQAKAVMESLMLTEPKVTDTSKVVANNFIQCLQNTPPAYASKEFIEAGSRWMCGNEVCDELGLGRPGYYYWAVFAGQCWLSMAICYTVRAVPNLDRKMIAVRWKPSHRHHQPIQISIG